MPFFLLEKDGYLHHKDIDHGSKIEHRPFYR
jgi:hypothetical protein